ncbi:MULTISPECIES: UvrY/SirA/GacA family response regulator transcription factor [Halomonadaceae]|uniref:UvrY/SirA/GacA family response regulator transcription factor n=1 Tax=Halomonadaceae TaxID=28256 RepID=UPI00159A8623|nr:MULTISPECIES: UvrY/SirA/GacA family response regulator transcription factor [Halomonas]QJQ94264.1 UvrY/SirA/GacA family response regulator transcription factor [Halomonas sp. PA5]
MIKVLVADDHHLVRTSIARLLDSEEGITVIGEAVSGEEAVSKARLLRPDIVLMDIRMPGIGGLEATRKIAKGMADIKVLVLTAFLEETFAQRLLDAGASGFITKGAELSDMVLAIRNIFAGQRYISPEIAQRLALTRMDAQENPFDALSHRELQVTIMIVNCQKVSEISDRLFLSPKTVNTYRYRIFEKLGVHSDVELTHLGLRYGLVEGYQREEV